MRSWEEPGREVAPRRGPAAPGESSPAPPRCPRAQDASSRRWPECRPWLRSYCCSARAGVPGPRRRRRRRTAEPSRTRTPSTCTRPTCSRTGSRAPRTSSCSSRPGNCSSRRPAGPGPETGGGRGLCGGRGPLRSGLAADVALAAGPSARKGGPRGESRKGLSAPPLCWSPDTPPPAHTHTYTYTHAHTQVPCPAPPNFLCWPDAAGARRPRALAWRVLPAGPSILGWIEKSKAFPKCDFPLCVEGGKR